VGDNLIEVGDRRVNNFPVFFFLSFAAPVSGAHRVDVIVGGGNYLEEKMSSGAGGLVVRREPRHSIGRIEETTGLVPLRG
jgi:hypothetical protein